MGSEVGETEHRRGLALGICLLAVVVAGTLGVGDWTLSRDAQASDAVADSADGLILWVGCETDVVNLTDSELDEWKSRGVDGFVCMTGRLRDLGGSQDFTGNPATGLNSSNYRLQRALRDSNVVERAAARGMKLYFGVKLANYYNPTTPLLDWFDGPGWAAKVLPKLRDMAGAAKLLGFAGIAIDQEMYPQKDGAVTATWNWDYPGNSHTEAEVREQARRRGAEVMDAILAGFPKAEFAVHHAFFPGDWRELIQEQVNGLTDTSTDRLDIDFWNGMTSVEGYGAIRFFDSVFYKGSHKGTWDSALTYNQNRAYVTFSRRFSNWDYAWSRVQVSPFAWIDEGPKSSSSDDARSADYVSEQLLAFRKWGMGGEFANFAYAPLDSFDYSSYVSAMRNASTPAKVDGEDPTLKLTRVSKASIEGTAHDNLAIRAVVWQDNRGRSGVADLSWEVLSGNYNSGYKWRTRWLIPAGALTPGATRVTIRAVDIKGHSSVAASIPVATQSSVAATPVAGGSPRITTKPPKRRTVEQRRATAAFTFTSDAGTQGFACSLDRRPWRECGSGRVTYRIRARRRWRSHTFEVRNGFAVASPESVAVRYRFKLRRR